MGFPAPRMLFATFLLLALPAHAALSIHPRGPTTETPVTLRIPTTCEILEETATRTGNQIHVAVRRMGPCPTPPLDVPHEVPLGLLPAGEYRVTVAGRADEVFTFVVRNAEPVPYELRPWAIPTNPDGMVVQIVPRGEFFCGGEGPDCSQFRVEIAGATYRIQDLDFSNGGTGIRPPPHAPGAVDVRITNADGTFLLPAALYYFDPGAPPDPSVFERVLFPVLFAAGGRNGSSWVSEAVIANPNLWAIQNLNSVEPKVCVTFPCGERLEKLSRVKFAGEGYPRGVALLMPRGESEDVSFSLRIRDVSREEDNRGTAVPVVREREMYETTEVPLLDVPLDARYRTKVRIYAFLGPFATDVRARVRFAPGGGFRDVILARACGGRACDALPWYGELDLAAGAAGEHVDLHVRLPADSFGWAFASVTNNATQQVTIVAPDGQGGKPCRERAIEICQ